MKIPPLEKLKKTDFREVPAKDFRKGLEAGRGYILAKRVLDVLFSLIALTVFSPLWLLLILLIRLDSKGRAIFKHRRVGKDGKTFMLYKFRTMKRGVKDEEFAPVSLADERITRVGKFLRKTSLDEVPQFYNVLRGEMSLVGPRPEMKFIVDTYTELQRARLLVLPGITGLWQVMGRKDLPLHENVECDLYYILHRSLWLDLKIILLTFIVVLKGKGAY